MIYTAKNINYEMTDEFVDLPNEIDVDVPDDVIKQGIEAINEYVSDEISNQTGFCHFGFLLTK